jgi:hypothetical protein
LLWLVIALAPVANAQWSWQVINYGGDLWISSLYNGVYQVQYRIGAGGSIQEIRYAPAGYIDLLAGEAPGEPFNQTDAVDQAVFWVQALKQDGIPGVAASCWNVNSAGDFANNFSRVIDVVYYPAQAVLDVWAVCDLQWQPGLDPYLGGGVAMLTQYKMNGDGSLTVRRVFEVPRFLKDGVDQGPQEMIVQNWHPFCLGLGTVAFSLDPSAAILNAFTAGGTGGSVDTQISESSAGYSVFTDAKALLTIGIVNGNKPASSPKGTSIRNYVQTTDWSTGVVSSNMLIIDFASAGDIVDTSFMIVPTYGLNVNYSSRLTSLVQSLPAPSYYQQGASFTNDLAQIVPFLQTIGKYQGVRTNQLGPYLQMR